MALKTSHIDNRMPIHGRKGAIREMVMHRVTNSVGIQNKKDLLYKKDLLSLELIKQADTDAYLTKLKKNLLSHLNRYPRAKFSAGAIPHNVSRVRKIDLQEALDGLVTDELIEKHINHQGQPLYCLVNEPEKREPVLDLPVCAEEELCTKASTPGGRQMRVKLRQLRLLEEPVFI